MLQAVVDFPVVVRGNEVIDNIFFEKIQKHGPVSS
jgi:hypothetical protein